MISVSNPALVHLAKYKLEDVETCELVAIVGAGRCTGAPIGVRLEDGFSDVVCEWHAAKAEERGAVVIRVKP